MAPIERPGQAHVHRSSCRRDTEGPRTMWLCGYAPYSTPVGVGSPVVISGEPKTCQFTRWDGTRAMECSKPWGHQGQHSFDETPVAEAQREEGVEP